MLGLKLKKWTKNHIVILNQFQNASYDGFAAHETCFKHGFKTRGHGYIIILLSSCFSTLTKHGEQVFTTSDETSLAINCGDESAPHSHILQCDYSVSDTCTSQDHYILRNTSFSCGKYVEISLESTEYPNIHSITCGQKLTQEERVW